MELVSSSANDDANGIALWETPAIGAAAQKAECAGIHVGDEVMVVERRSIMETRKGRKHPIWFYKVFDKSLLPSSGRGGKWVAASNFLDGADLFELVEEVAGPEGGAAAQSARAEYVDVQAPLSLKSPMGRRGLRFGDSGSFQVRRAAASQSLRFFSSPHLARAAPF